MNKSPLIGMTGCKGGTTDREEMRAILLWPLPIEFYEVKYRLQPLGNKREDTFSGREGPEAAPPSSMSSSTKHCSVQEEPQLFIDPQEASFWDFFFFFRPSAAPQHDRQPTPKRWRGRLWRTPADTLAKE